MYWVQHTIYSISNNAIPCLCDDSISLYMILNGNFTINSLPNIPWEVIVVVFCLILHGNRACLYVIKKWQWAVWYALAYFTGTLGWLYFWKDFCNERLFTLDSHFISPDEASETDTLTCQETDIIQVLTVAPVQIFSFVFLYGTLRILFVACHHDQCSKWHPEG